jgi:hypothetical protein
MLLEWIIFRQTSYKGLFYFFTVLGIKPRASYMLHKCSATELHPQPHKGHFRNV